MRRRSQPDARIETEADDAIDELGVSETGLEGGLGEIFVSGEKRVWVGLDKVHFVVWGEAEVDARVTVDGEQMINALAGLLDFPDEERIETFGELVLEAPALLVFRVPFGAVGGDFGFVGWNFAENEFADGKDLEAMVTEDADVEFAAFDVFLGNGVVIEFLVDELDAFLELIIGFDE